MTWWSWERWEAEIDWMALHGINLPMAFTGARTPPQSRPPFARWARRGCTPTGAARLLIRALGAPLLCLPGLRSAF